MNELAALRRTQAEFCAELGLETTTLTTSTQVPLFYVMKERPGRPWLVFLHGFPDSWWVWREQIRHFARDYSVLAFDLPGFGRSLAPLSPNALAIQDVVAPTIARQLAALDGPVHLIGHDLGALVAWFCALQCQAAGTPVAGLTVFGIGHPMALIRAFRLPTTWLKARHWFAFSLPRPIPERAFRAFDWYLLRRLTGHHPEFASWQPELSRDGALTAALDWFRSNLLPRLWPDAATPRILDADVLAIRTDGDLEYTSREQLDDTRAFVRGVFRIEHLANLSHWPMCDDPQRVNQLIEGFL